MARGMAANIIKKCCKARLFGGESPLESARMHRQHSCHRGDVGGRGAECLLDSCSDPWYPPHELSGDLLEAMQRGFDAIAPAIAQYT
jgi:hypothetical protein